MSIMKSFLCIHRYSRFEDFYCDPQYNSSCAGCKYFYPRPFSLPFSDKIYPFDYHSLADHITVLNFLYPDKVLLVSQDWYCHMIKYGYSSDCSFICEISTFRHTPLIPQLLTDSDLFV